MVYDDLMLRDAKARQRALWDEARRQGLRRQLLASTPRRATRWLLAVSQALMTCGVRLRTWYEARLAPPPSVALLTVPLSRRVPWRHHGQYPKRHTF